MTKRSCKQCGRALTKGARFCTSCGAIVGAAETGGVLSLETRPFTREQTDPAPPRNIDVTEELPSPRKPPSEYETEEIPQRRVTAPVGEISTSSVVGAPSTQPQIKLTESASAHQPSGGRKGLLLAAALGAVALALGSFFFVNSRLSSETSETDQTAEAAESVTPIPDASHQSVEPSVKPSVEPSVKPSGGDADNPAQSQTGPQLATAPGETRSTANQSSLAEKKSPEVRIESKPAPTASQANKVADGTGAASHNLNQGIRYMNTGQFQEALREFEYVRKLDPGNKSVYYLIGQTYHKMDQLERALEAYRQCTSGVYASVAQSNVRMLEKKLGKTY